LAFSIRITEKIYNAKAAYPFSVAIDRMLRSFHGVSGLARRNSVRSINKRVDFDVCGKTDRKADSGSHHRRSRSPPSAAR
jgi:hypothetical protein